LSAKKHKWDEAYKDAEFSGAAPAQVLLDNVYLLPQSGEALDLACGRAGNAQFLAKRDFEVDAMDVSSVALDGLGTFIKQHELSISCELRDIESEGLGNKKYDVIVVSYFLNGELFPQIIAALKPEGLLFYQTWSQLKVDDRGPSNPEFRLKEGEFLELCSPLQTVFYRENGVLGDISDGLRNEAMIIAKKRP
jgi:SAM-dependent methyltransferase